MSPPNSMVTILTTTFQLFFLLHAYMTHLLYEYWRRYIGYCCSNSPNIYKKILDYSRYILGRKTGRDALNSQWADDMFDLFPLLLISHIG
jgi:hypothetical protein